MVRSTIVKKQYNKYLIHHPLHIIVVVVFLAFSILLLVHAMSFTQQRQMYAAGCTPPNCFSISGNIYNDSNGSQYYDPPNETFLSGRNGNVTVKDSNGNTVWQQTNIINSYTTGAILSQGIYTVTYSNLPSGYNMSYPLFGVPPSYSVTVGNGPTPIPTNTPTPTPTLPPVNCPVWSNHDYGTCANLDGQHSVCTDTTLNNGNCPPQFPTLTGSSTCNGSAPNGGTKICCTSTNPVTVSCNRCGNCAGSCSQVGQYCLQQSSCSGTTPIFKVYQCNGNSWAFKYSQQNGGTCSYSC